MILASLLCGGLAIPGLGADTSVRVHGTITDKDTGRPIPGAYVVISDMVGNTLSTTSSDSAGSYTFTVPQKPAYAISVSSWIDKGAYYVSNYVIGSAVGVPGDVTDIRTDFALRPGANLILEAYAADGTMLRRVAFFSAVNNQAYATDLNDVPNFGVSSNVHDAYSEAHGWSYDLTVPAFVVPLKTPTRLHVLWDIPSFGRVVVDLDDGGKGYTLSQAGDFRVLNLNRELAASAVARLKQEMDDAAKAGYSLSSGIAAGYNSAQAALQQGDVLLAPSPADMTQPVAAFNNSLAGALLTEESLYLEKAQTDIPRYRQGKLRLQVRNPDGTPVAGAKVSYSQQTHDFQFGGSYLSVEDYPAIGDQFAAAGFNASSVFLSWQDLEPTPGKYDFPYALDSMSSFTALSAKGFRILGAVAYWANSDPTMANSACPDYWRQMTFEQMTANVRNHIYALASAYGSRIAPWMISEQNIQNCLGLTWPQKMQVHDIFMDGLHAGFPGAQNLVTGVAMPYGWQQDPFDNSPGVAGGISLPLYLSMLVSGHHALDMIGLEYYHFGVTTWPPYYPAPGWSLAAMARNLDSYAQYGVPVYVEEFQVPSTQEPSSSWWHRPWDPQTQAEFAEKFYTLAFSRPSVQDIQWSTELSDRNSFIKNAGLFDANYQPKPVFYGLRDLIQSWTTSGSTTTDAQGQADIVGFAGDYRLQVVAPGDVAPDIKTHVYEQKDIAQTIAYQGLPAVAVVSAASFAPGPVAPDSIAAIFGTRLATGVAQAESASLPGSLLGTTVQIRDSKGVAYAAPLFSVSPGQVNVLIPANVAAGQATLTILSGDGASQSSTLQIQTVAPGIFQLNGDALAAAQILRVNAAGERTLEPVFQAAGGQVVAAPIDVGPPTDQLFLSLYGTGLRNRSALSSVQVTIGGLSTPALYAGPQGSPGLDQINVALDRALAGRGMVDVSVVVDGRAGNVTRLLMR